MLDKIIKADQELFLFLNSLGNENWDGFWLFMTDKWSSIPLYVFLLILCFRTLGKKHTLAVLLITALLITCTDQLANLFKYGFERFRPCHEPEVAAQMRLVKAYCGGKFGYFSAHAANSFAVTTFFSLLFRNKYSWLPFLMLIWALFVAYSRIYIGVHYPLDVITGITIGMLLGVGAYTLFGFLRSRIPLN